MLLGFGRPMDGQTIGSSLCLLGLPSMGRGWARMGSAWGAGHLHGSVSSIQAAMTDRPSVNGRRARENFTACVHCGTLPESPDPAMYGLVALGATERRRRRQKRGRPASKMMPLGPKRVHDGEIDPATPIAHHHGHSQARSLWLTHQPPRLSTSMPWHAWLPKSRAGDEAETIPGLLRGSHSRWTAGTRC